MSLKHPLVITCAVIAITATVRTHANPARAQAALAPTTFFGDIARSPEPKSAQAFNSTRAIPGLASTASPFVLDVPRPIAPSNGDAGIAPAAEIDLSALRYFAAQNDLGRVSAEIRLLRTMHPDWEPPPDLFSESGSGIDEQPLWRLLSLRDFGGIHTKMDDIRRDKPDWHPTSDFAGKLALAEAHDALSKASNAHQWGTVIETASATPAMLTCGDVDALWRTAEALVRTGDQARAVAAYRYILANCTPADVRLATVQKASALLTAPENLESLLQMGRASPDGRGEFAQVRLDLLRRKVGDATANAGAMQPTAEEVAALTSSATDPAGQADAQLLGWYARSRKDYQGAERWFRAALAAGPNAKAAEGLVLTLRDAGNASEARKLAFQYAGLAPPNRKLTLEIAAAGLSDPKAAPLSHDELAVVTEAADDLKSSDGAQALGWYVFKQNDILGAENWFRKSIDWQPNEPAAVGLVLSARRLHHDRDYTARIAEYRATYPRVAELETLMRTRVTARQLASVHVQGRLATATSVKVARTGHRSVEGSGDGWDRSADDIMNVYNGGQYATAVEMLDQRRQKHAEPRGLSVVHAWALYHNGDWEGAKRIFSSLDGGSYSRERSEGLRVIQEAYTPPRLR